MAKESAHAHVTLDYPLIIDGQNVSTLTMRRSVVRDHLEAAKHTESNAAQEAALFARLVGVNPEDFSELDYADYIKLQDVYLGFLRPAEAGGSDASPALEQQPSGEQ